MKREELTALGVTPEQVEKIMAIHGADTQRQKQLTESERTRREELESQLSQRDRDMEALKDAAGGSEALKTQFETLQSRYTTEKAELEEKLQRTRLEGALETQLLKSRARDTTAVRAMLNLEKVSLKEDGTLKGLEEQLEQLQKEKAWAFGEPVRAEYQPAGGEGGEPALDFRFTGVRPQPSAQP